MILTALALAAAIWTMPSGPVAKPTNDRLPAPSIAMRWNVPSGLSAAPIKLKSNTPVGNSPVCQQIGTHKAGEKGALLQGPKEATLIAGTRKLSEEPNADAISAVLYSEGQCSKPIVVSRDKGMNPRRK